jgi:hypothetical protein
VVLGRTAGVAVGATAGIATMLSASPMRTAGNPSVESELGAAPTRGIAGNAASTRTAGKSDTEG